MNSSFMWLQVAARLNMKRAHVAREHMSAHVLKDMQEDKILNELVVAIITLEFLVWLVVSWDWFLMWLERALECARNYKKSADIYISALEYCETSLLTNLFSAGKAMRTRTLQRLKRRALVSSRWPTTPYRWGAVDCRYIDISSVTHASVLMVFNV